MFAPVVMTRTAFTVCTNRPLKYVCVFKHAHSVQCVCLTISGCMRNSVTNICDLEVSGCTCQIEIWVCGVIFM